MKNNDKKTKNITNVNKDISRKREIIKEYKRYLEVLKKVKNDDMLRRYQNGEVKTKTK